MPTDQAKSRGEIIDGIDSAEDLADQNLEITSVEDWNKPREAAEEMGVIIRLPSNRVVKVRRTMDMMTMLQAGKIPNPLAAIVNGMINEGVQDFAQAIQQSEDPEAIRQLFELINQTMVKTFVDPKVSVPPVRETGEDWDNYIERIELPEKKEDETEKDYQKRYYRDGWHKKGTLSVFDIDMPDKMFVFAVAQGAATSLARFRDESESAMGSVQPGKRVVKPSKRTGGTRSKK